MSLHTKNISSIEFGILSPEEIIAMSVCEITSSKVSGPGTVYDPRMGSDMETGSDCISCGKTAKACSGHFAYIKLNEPVIHPLYYKYVVSFLRCFCKNCYRLLITADQVKLKSLDKFKGEKRFLNILKKLTKVDMCCHCNSPQADISYSSSDGTISLVYKQKTIAKSEHGKKGVSKNTKISIVLTVDDVKKIFDNILVDDVILLGFDPNKVQPRNLIITVYPVIPPCSRPFVVADGNVCDDDLTNQYMEIIKINNQLKSDQAVNEKKRQKASNSLKFRILTFMNNCLAPDTPVLMWDGSVKRADEVKVDDKIIGDDGMIRIVQTTCTGTDNMYEVKQNKGESYTVNSNHILTLQYSGHKSIFWSKPDKYRPLGAWLMKWFDQKLMTVKTKCVSVTKKRDVDTSLSNIKLFAESIPDNNVFDISIKEYIKLPHHITRCFMGFKCQGVNWEKHPVTFDPYLLGMWLGDGNRDGKGFTSADKELVDYWKKWADENQAEVVLHKNKGKKDIYFGIKSRHNTDVVRHNLNPLRKSLDKYNLVKNKHIPREYLVNDRETRLKVLAGIIDTDGYVNNGKEIEICQGLMHKRIIEDTAFLAKSLGFSANITIKNTTWTYNNEKRTGKAYKLNISGKNANQIPTLLARKKISDPISRNVLCSKITITPVGIGNYAGFSIDKNKRFLLGDFTVTHNSQGKAKHPTNKRPVKGIKERLTGKGGLVRAHLMGKRCDFSGRTVIGPDPSLRLGEVALPEKMAKVLTYPERVTKYNKERLEGLVNNDKANHIKRMIKGRLTNINLSYATKRRGTKLLYGDIVVREGEELEVMNDNVELKEGDKIKRKGVFIPRKEINYPRKRHVKVEIGDIVDRHIQDGDMLLLNRQPTEPLR